MKLLEQTQQYWLVSSTWNHRIESELTVDDAMASVRGIISNIGPSRRLTRSAAYLMTELIMQPKRTKPKRGKKLTAPIPMQKQPIQTTN